jgi:uncharacterized membrane protein YphA (DoxX/SURF4 family)
MLTTALLLAARSCGAIFIFAGVTKLMDRAALHATLRALGSFPPRSIVPIASTLPGVELGVGTMLLIGLWTAAAAWAALALLLAFSIVAMLAVAHGLDVPCSCFGAVSQAPLSRKTAIRNLLLALPLLPLAVPNRPTVLSVDAVRAGSAVWSPMDLLLIVMFPACVVGLAILIATAQQTLERITAR